LKEAGVNYYENLIIIDPNLGEEEIEKATERIKHVITKSNGEVLREEFLGVKKLAYDVKKHKNGLYILMVFRSPSATISELEQFYRVFEPVLKSLIVKLKKKEIAVLKISEPKGEVKEGV